MIAGVLLHLPMLSHAQAMGGHMAGMAMDPAMITGMILIATGATVACYGALPSFGSLAPGATAMIFEAPPSTRLNRWHGGLLAVLTLGLVIDVMKPATLGFVLPGLAKEYGVPRSTAALLPLVALIGTTIGSFLWGWLADLYGRRPAIIVSTILFVSTSVCGAMPTFEWNLVMCFVMGLSAGGMLPVVYTLLTELLPPRHRSWLLVLVGGMGLVGGYLAASVSAYLFEPVFGWRVLWLQGFPTGLLLLLLARFIPESPRFLVAHGRSRELDELQKKFGLSLQAPLIKGDVPQSVERGSVRLAAALTIAALSWSFINFGLLLWLPSDLQARGLSASLTSGLITKSTLIGLPAIMIVAWSYGRWSSKWTLVGTLLLTLAGLIGLLLPSSIFALQPVTIAVIAILIVGTNGTIAALLPYSAESYSARIRGRATGLVAGSSKLGGVAVQTVGLLGLFPTLGEAALVLLVPSILSAGLIAWAGIETKGKELRELDAT